MINRRHVYVLLFAVPALLVSIIAAALMLAASAGALWLFVYGDDPWPNTANVLLGAIFFLAAAALWLALLFVAYMVGRQQEGEQSLNKGHVALSLGATVVLAVIIIVRVAGLNVAGAQSDSVVCRTCAGRKASPRAACHLETLATALAAATTPKGKK